MQAAHRPCGPGFWLPALRRSSSFEDLILVNGRMRWSRLENLFEEGSKSQDYDPAQVRTRPPSPTRPAQFTPAHNPPRPPSGSSWRPCLPCPPSTPRS